MATLYSALAFVATQMQKHRSAFLKSNCNKRRTALKVFSVTLTSESVIPTSTTWGSGEWDTWQVRRRDLLEDGFTIVPRMLGAAQISQCKMMTERLLTSAHGDGDAQRAIGSLIDILCDPSALELITWPRAFGALGALGFPDARFQHGMLFNKAPRTPRTFWHQDGAIWNHPRGYAAEPFDLIFIYYLVDTSVRNGCLRVLPGSHRRRHPLHEILARTDTAELRRMADPTHPAFATLSGELELPCATGDVVILDSRLLHATHANDSDSDRRALSLWYLTHADALPEAIHARYTFDERRDSRMPYVPSAWSATAQERLRAVLPAQYTGTARPLALDYNPGPELV